MLLSFGAKRAFPISKNVLNLAKTTPITSTRPLSFSSWGAGSDGTAHGDKKAYSTHTNNDVGASSSSTATATTTTSSHNYESASFKSLINYDVSVAFQPKNRTESNLFKAKNSPKSTSAIESPSGEDNLFVSQQSEDGYISLGVADGVGGWSEAGYDSSAISRELCAQMKAIFESSNEKVSLTPKNLLNNAFDNILQSPKVEIGGTTACLGILTPDYKLKVANLGDSWCGVFRDYKLINETSFQTHNFNTPYQLAKIPKQIMKQAESQGKRYIIDNPNMADEYLWNLQKNDIIIFATDGVTDNVIARDIEIFLQDQFDSNSNPDLDKISKKFVKEVVKVSKDPNFPSAFAQELSKLTGQRYLGGKEDDITVVFIKVT